MRTKMMSAVLMSVMLIALAAMGASASGVLNDNEIGMVRGGCSGQCVDWAPSCSLYNCTTPTGGCDSDRPCAKLQKWTYGGQECMGCKATGGTADCTNGGLTNCGAAGPCQCQVLSMVCVWSYVAPACHPPACGSLQ